MRTKAFVTILICFLCLSVILTGTINLSIGYKSFTGFAQSISDAVQAVVRIAIPEIPLGDTVHVYYKAMNAPQIYHCRVTIIRERYIGDTHVYVAKCDGVYGDEIIHLNQTIAFNIDNNRGSSILAVSSLFGIYNFDTFYTPLYLDHYGRS